MLAIVLDPASVARIDAAARAGEEISVDLVAQEIHIPRAPPFRFAAEPARREALLNGWDEIGRIHAGFGAQIAAFETRQRAAAPWLWTAEQGPVNA